MLTFLWAQERSWAEALLRMIEINFDINVLGAALIWNIDFTLGAQY
jgi:hypothetical protein